MSKVPEQLQQLYEALQASPAARHLTKIHWEDRPQLLSIRNTWGDEDDDIIIHIRVDKQQPEKFTYHVLSNKDRRIQQHTSR